MCNSISISDSFGFQAKELAENPQASRPTKAIDKSKRRGRDRKHRSKASDRSVQPTIASQTSVTHKEENGEETKIEENEQKQSIAKQISDRPTLPDTAVADDGREEEEEDKREKGGRAEDSSSSPSSSSSSSLSSSDSEPESEPIEKAPIKEIDQSEAQESTKRAKKRQCLAFKRGRCHRGDGCPMLHSNPTKQRQSKSLPLLFDSVLLLIDLSVI